MTLGARLRALDDRALARLLPVRRVRRLVDLDEQVLGGDDQASAAQLGASSALLGLLAVGLVAEALVAGHEAVLVGAAACGGVSAVHGLLWHRGRRAR